MGSVSGSVQAMSGCGTWGYGLGAIMVVIGCHLDLDNLEDVFQP